MGFELKTPCLKHNILSAEPLILCSLMMVVDSFIDNSVLYDLKNFFLQIVGFEQIPKFSSLPKRQRKTTVN